MTTIANDKLRRAMRSTRPGPVRRFMRRVNPMMLAGAVLAGALLFHVATRATGEVIECRPAMVRS